MRVTIKDVAKKAGVSITTVSMVLNNTNYKIKNETKERVRKAADDLGYIPNNLAKSLLDTEKQSDYADGTQSDKSLFRLSLRQYFQRISKKRLYPLFIRL